ncbi:MAG: hypothetical protein VKL58_05305, partial [Cyanobacteriota bacterium]|nr:hypothetical protein [Cyanobacteriota bacterium]
GLAALHDGDAAVCGAEVNANDFSHGFPPPGVDEMRTACIFIRAPGATPGEVPEPGPYLPCQELRGIPVGA